MNRTQLAQAAAWATARAIDIEDVADVEGARIPYATMARVFAERWGAAELSRLCKAMGMQLTEKQWCERPGGNRYNYYGPVFRRACGEAGWGGLL